ncbi:MAG TPA: hypothetical protein VN372_10110 [Methanospirillum sp.]|nr:hypothetical protein [Methanospirillum sp.]
MKGITIVLVLGLIALAIVLPASAAGQGGNGKMLQSAAGSGQQCTGCHNQNCPHEDCPNNQTPPQDGSGLQYGKNVNR